MSAYDTYAAALAPYVTRQANRIPNLSGAIQKMIDYNSRMGLGLSDEQIVAGIKAFGDRSAKQWGTATPLTQQANYNAIAAESIERALGLAGRQPEADAFWNNAQKDAYPVTSDGILPAWGGEGTGGGHEPGSMITKGLRGHSGFNWNYDTGGAYSYADPLENAVSSWVASYPLNNIFTPNSVPTNSHMLFSDVQIKDVATIMRSFNTVLKLDLTDEEMVKGINRFSKAQYGIYQQGYNIGSDPYNIARWSLWNSLNDKGKTDVGNLLIERTNAKQALTAQHAEEIYNKQHAALTEYFTEYERQRKKANDLSFGDHLKNIAKGAAPVIALFSGLGTLLGPAAGAAAVSGSGIAASFADLIGVGEFYSSATSAIGSLGSSVAELVGATGSAANAITTGINSAVTSGGVTALTGGSFSDVLTNAVTSGLTSGGASIVGNTVAGAINGVPTGATDDQYTSVDTASQTERFPLTGTVAGAAAGATGGIINAGLNGGNIGDAALTGAVAGGVSGGVGVDAGAGQTVGNAVGGIVGSVVNQELQDDTTQTASTGTDTTGATTTVTDTVDTDTDTTNDYALNWGGTPSFASLLPAITGRPEWGTRLSRRTV